jgi:ribonuclease Z
MVDCGEGTQQQLLKPSVGAGQSLKDIKTIFITHLHADHVLGLVPLLYSMMGPSAGPMSSTEPRVTIFGPLGLKALIRTQLTLCYASLSGRYVVHELIWPEQIETSSSGSSQLETDRPLTGAVNGPQRVIPDLPRHASELPGNSIVLDTASCTWPQFTTIDGTKVSAAPILHRCPTLAYVFEEPSKASLLLNDTIQRLDANAAGLLANNGTRNPRSLLGRLVRDRVNIELPDGTTLHPPPLDVAGRKVVICGDTHDATGGLPPNQGLVSIAQDADLLVHEATNAALPAEFDRGNRTIEEVTQRARERGHSTPQGAGAFAASIGASLVILNHFSVRYNAPNTIKNRALMDYISAQAFSPWLEGLNRRRRGQLALPTLAPRKVFTAFDGMTWQVLRPAELEDRTASDAARDIYWASEFRNNPRAIGDPDSLRIWTFEPPRIRPEDDRSSGSGSRGNGVRGRGSAGRGRGRGRGPGGSERAGQSRDGPPTGTHLRFDGARDDDQPRPPRTRTTARRARPFVRPGIEERGQQERGGPAGEEPQLPRYTEQDPQALNW